MRGYWGVYKGSFELDVARSQMFISDVIKARNAYVKCKQHDLSQISHGATSYYTQWEKRYVD